MANNEDATTTLVHANAVAISQQDTGMSATSNAWMMPPWNPTPVFGSTTTWNTSNWDTLLAVPPTDGQSTDTLSAATSTPIPPLYSIIPTPPQLPNAHTVPQAIPSRYIPVSSERTTNIEDVYLVLGHKDWLEPAKIYDLNVFDLSGRVESTTDVTAQATFRFLDLPKEVQTNVFSALFRDCRRELGYLSSIKLWHPCAIRRALLATTTISISQDTCHLGIALPEDFIQLFVSRQFLADALSIFAEHTTIDIWHFHIHNILPLLAPYPLLDRIFSVLLANTSCLAVEDWNLSKSPSPYALTMTNWTWNIKVLEIHTEAPLLWKARSRHSASDKIIWDHIHGIKWPSLHVIEYLDWLQFTSTLKYPLNLKERLKKGLSDDTRYRNMKKLGKRLKIEVRLRTMLACKVKERWTGPVAGIQGLSSYSTSSTANVVLNVVTSEIVEVSPKTHINCSVDRMWKYEHAAAEFLCGQSLPQGVRGGCRNAFLLRDINDADKARAKD